MDDTAQLPLVAIACGGTGGHLFPGLAVADQLRARDCRVQLLISPKEVDQKAVQSVGGMDIKILPAVGLSGGRYLAFFRGFWQSYRLSKSWFAAARPQAVLAMGGFTSAPPIHAGRAFGAAAFLHESNTIPGRANRWLARFVHQAFVGFPSAAQRLRAATVLSTGTPVRPQFQPLNRAAARAALGLRPDAEVLLVMGGSQGASGINQLAMNSLDLWQQRLPDWQFLHLAGDRDFEAVRQAYAARGLPAKIWPFLGEMERVMGAATVAISRAGASSQAELAALRLPAVLIPFPAAADNHQYYNARAFADAGAARLLEQREANPKTLWAALADLTQDAGTRAQMADAVFRWHRPEAAAQIAESMLILMQKLHGFAPACRASGLFAGTEGVMA